MGVVRRGGGGQWPAREPNHLCLIQRGSQKIITVRGVWLWSKQHLHGFLQRHMPALAPREPFHSTEHGGPVVIWPADPVLWSRTSAPTWSGSQCLHAPHPGHRYHVMLFPLEGYASLTLAIGSPTRGPHRNTETPQSGGPPFLCWCRSGAPDQPVLAH